jgi:hypothetical protein
VAMADLAATTTDTGDSGSNLVHQVAQFRGATKPQTRDPAHRFGRVTAADEGIILSHTYPSGSLHTQGPGAGLPIIRAGASCM